MGADYNIGPRVFEYQAPAVLNQAAPIQNDWYVLLPTTLNCRVYKAVVNIEDTNETVEMEINIDGQTIQGNGFALVHSTSYYAVIEPNAITRIDLVDLFNDANIIRFLSFLCEGRSVQIRVRKTTAAGVGNLTGIVTYGILL